MKLIALYSSRPQCGKSTVAERLRARHSFAIEKFAFPLKKMLGALFDEVMPPHEVRRRLEGDLKEIPIAALGFVTPRRMMQTLGTEWGRGLDPDFWVQVMEARLSVHDARYSSARIVVDDMRFPNEFDAMRRFGATLVRVDRPGESVTPSHASEGALDHYEFTHTIQNTGSLEDLYTQVDRLVK